MQMQKGEDARKDKRTRFMPCQVFFIKYGQCFFNMIVMINFFRNKIKYSDELRTSSLFEVS